MVRTIKPLGNKVLCAQIMPEMQTASGILFLEKYRDDRKRFRVLACGPGLRLKNGALKPIEAEPGDQIICNMLGQDRYQLEDGTQRWVIDAREIVAVVKKEANGNAA